MNYSDDPGIIKETNTKNGQDRPPKKILLIPEASELVFYDEEVSPVRCDTFIFDPAENETTLGSLYLVLETLSSSGKSAEIIESVATAIKKEYYRDTARNMSDSLEEALKQANLVLSDYIEQGEIEPVENFHASACSFSGSDVHISRVGNAELLLSHKSHLIDIGEGLSDNNLRRPHHAFTSVASGTVAEGDFLLLATPELSRLIPHDRLNQMLIGKSPAEIVRLLRSLLDDSRENTSFALLVLQFAKMPERLPAPAVPLDLPRRASITPANNVRTNHIRPRRPITTKRTVLSNLKRIVGQIVFFSWKFAREKIFPAIVSLVFMSFDKTRSLFSAFSERRQQKKEPIQRENYTESEEEFENSYEEAESNLETEKVKLRNRVGLILASAIRKTVGLIMSFKGNNKIIKILLLIILIFVILFMFGLRALSKKRQEDATIRGIVEKLEHAKVKKDNADSALIYNNSEKARQDIKEARLLAEEVSKTEYYDSESTALLTALKEMEDRMERVTRISSPRIIGDFASAAPSLKTIAMAVVADKIYTFDPSTNAIYELNSKNAEVKTVSQSSQGIGYFRSVLPLAAEKTILFSTDTPGLAMFDTVRGDMVKQEIKFPDGVTNIKAVSVFGSRLYVLSPEKKMIYGFSKTLAGYDGGGEWLKDKNIQADHAVSMGVDGYIYLLMNDGKIIKMLKGVASEFKQEMPARAIDQPTRMLIYDGLKHIYILDPLQNRVLVYDTVGNITNQFVFPDESTLKDIAIGGNEEMLYVLDGTKVIELPLK